MIYRQNTELDREESGLELTSQSESFISTQDIKDHKLARDPLEPIAAFSRKTKSDWEVHT